MAEFELVVRGRTSSCRTRFSGWISASRTDSSPTSGRSWQPEPRRSTPPASTSFPAGSIRTSTSTSPGRTEWEGVATGTRALAAGGFTTYVDMPLNNVPVTVDGPSFDVKLPAVQASSLVDFALWGGLVAGNVERLAEQHERGVAGFKAFMCHSGIDEFPAVDDLSLYEGMKGIAALGSILLLHAENAAIVAGLGARARELGRVSPRDFVESRPAVAELEAIEPCDPHRRGHGLRDPHRPRLDDAPAWRMVAEAQGARCRRDLRDVSPLPPVHGGGRRARGNRAQVRAARQDGRRSGRALGSARGREAADGHVRPLTRGARGEGRGLLHRVGRDLGLPVDAPAPARRRPLRSRASARGRRGRDRGERGRALRASGKGTFAPGNDADLALVDLSFTGTVELDDLQYRHRFSAYEGLPIRGRIVRTILRGRTVYADGAFAPEPLGRFLTPGRKP